MAVVLDTSALIEMEKALQQGTTPGLPRNEIVVLPCIVWAEALVGVRLADSPARAARRRAHLESIRQQTNLEPFTPEIAEHYADIYAELTGLGALIPQNDIMVAATCRSLRFNVLVGPRDEAHFRRVPGLSVTVISA